MNPSAEIKNRTITFHTATRQNSYCRMATLFYVLEGQAAFAYDNRRVELDGSDILVINRGTEYICTGTKGMLLASLDLTGDTFEAACDGVRFFVDCNSTQAGGGPYTQMRSLLRQMILCQIYVQEDKQKYSYLAFEYYSLYYKLLETVVSHFLQGYAYGPGQKPGSTRNPERRETIERYLNIHYMEPISLDNVANELFLSKNTLSKYFSQTFGIPFSQYLKDLRLKHAMSDLLYTDHPITQIVFDNGFSGSSFFNKAFREKFNKNPREARAGFQKENMREKGQPGRKDIHQRVKKLLDADSIPQTAQAQKGRTDFSVQDCQPIGPCWRSLINIGSASEMLRTDIQSHIQILSRYYTYARFWDPFSEEMLLHIGGQGSYNFLRLDQVLDSLLATGVKPFIVFEPKLERVNEGVDSVIIRARHETEIEDLHAWKDIVTAFVRHIVQKYGAGEVETWQLELTYGVYQLRGFTPLESYLALFRALAETVRQYAPRLPVGGPALPACEPELPQVLAGLRASGLTPGFVSMISFAYEVNERAHKYSIRSIDEEYLLKDVKRFRQIMTENGLGGCPLYITEWNETVADRNFLNDSCYRGAYMVKNLLDIYPYVAAAGYFSGTDLRAEYFDSNALLQGGNGLISRDGICKPAGFAVRLLHMLGEYRISSGPQFLVTTDKRDNYYIIAHNKRKLSLYAYQTPEGKIEKEKLGRFCEDAETLRLSLVLTDVKDGEYRVREHRVNASFGSILDLWKELDFRKALSRKDIQYLQRICEPHLHFHTAVVTGHKLPLEAALEPNEILLLEVKLDI